jgi:hypothetical protein
MQSETKTCQNCGAHFVIEPDDFDFYKKIDVPPPTFCPECRLQRRLAFFNLVKLYKRDCDLCQKPFVSMYHPDAPLKKVFCAHCFFSDNWDPFEEYLEIDFSLPFLKQFQELWQKAPMLGLSLDTTASVNSDYNNHADSLKNCYLNFHAWDDEDCLYTFYSAYNKTVLDSQSLMKSTLCYDMVHAFQCNSCAASYNLFESQNSYFMRDCVNCQDCYGCTNLKNKKHCFLNEQLTKDEYEKKLRELNLGSWSGYQAAKKQAHNFWKTQAPKPLYMKMSPDSTGNYIFQCKNCKECYDASDSEDCKYLFMCADAPIQDNYDISSWGSNMKRCYEGNVVGEDVSDVRFSQESGIDLYNADYCKASFGSKDLFGCVGMKKGEYCILNKQYTKEDYFKLKAKITQHMNDTPYTDTQGNIYKYGEFFPMELSPFDYRYTLAANFFPLSDEEIKERGLTMYDDIENEYTITIEAGELPDHINDVDDTILNEVIACEKTGKAYKIHPMELQFLRQMELPLPRVAPMERINEKINIWTKEMRLIERTSTLSGETFQTHYTEAEAPVIYSPEEYKREFLA